MPDPRTTAGELMCPELYPADRVSKLKRELLRDFDAHSSSSSPTTETGAHFHRAWLPVRDRASGGGSGVSLSLLGSRLHETNTGQRIQTGQPAPLSHAGRMASTAVDDVVKLRDTPGVVDKTILAVTQQDGQRRARAHRAADRDRRRVPGRRHTSKLFAGYDYKLVASRPERSPTRWRGLSVQAEGGNVWLSEGAWNDPVCARTPATCRGDTMTRRTRRRVLSMRSRPATPCKRIWMRGVVG